MFPHYSITCTLTSLCGIILSSYAALFCSSSYAQTAAPLIKSTPVVIQPATTFAPEQAQLHDSVTKLINNYRRILSLQAFSTSIGISAQQHLDAVRAGEYFFIENQRLSSSIAERLIKPHAAPQDIDDVLAAISSTTLLDADLFAVRSIMTEVAKKAQLTPAQGKQVRMILKELAIAHHKYGQELTGALSQKTISQSKPERPAWSAYLAQVEQQFPATTLLDELKTTLQTPEPQAVPSEKIGDVIAEARKNEWQGLQFEKGSVLLTFDDGPHPVYTQEILSILAHYKLHAIFFQLGQNLGTITDGHAALTRNEEVEKELLANGHAIANHSFTHPFLPKLDQAQVQQEIDKTQLLLNLIIPDDAQRTHMFRAPYGARNSMILGEIGERGLRSVLWNVDSLDWSDPVPESIVHRILQELEHAGRGIILMHDIHPKTVIALPMLLDELIKRGYHFVEWNGTELVPTNRDVVPATPSENSPQLTPTTVKAN